MTDVQIMLIQPTDVHWVIELFIQQVYVEDPGSAFAHFADHTEGQGSTFLARIDGQLAGFITIRWQSHNPLFRGEGIPLIHHLEVFPPFQRRGIASRLMDEAETLIATRANKAGITVGLFDAYGPAQALYARRGYIPDGRGVCRNHEPLKQGDAITMDHDVILWLTKELAPSVKE